MCLDSSLALSVSVELRHMINTRKVERPLSLLTHSGSNIYELPTNFPWSSHPPRPSLDHRIRKQRNTKNTGIWRDCRCKTEENCKNGHLDETQEKHVKVPRSYANQCKKEVIVDVEIPIGLRCRNAIHRNFGGVVLLIQRSSLGKKSNGLESSNIPMKILQSKEALTATIPCFKVR